MEVKEMLSHLDRLLESSKVAILANVDQNGAPRVRWMSPSLVRGQEECLYAITSPAFTKTSQLEANPNVQWMVQTRAMDEIISIYGKMHVIDNPSLKSTVIEAIGGKLGTFWKLNDDPSQVVVLETIIESMEYFKPSSGEKIAITVEKGE